MGGHFRGPAFGVCATACTDWLPQRHPSFGFGFAPHSLYVDGQFADVWRLGHHAVCPDEPERTPRRFCHGGAHRRCSGILAGGCRHANHPNCWLGAGHRRGPRRQAPPRGGLALRHAVVGSHFGQRLAESVVNQFLTPQTDSSGARLCCHRHLHQSHFVVETRSSWRQTRRTPSRWFLAKLACLH